MKLVISNLNKSYGDKKVLEDIDFTFESGKIYGLIGRNGAGKTTLFNSINEDIEVDSAKFSLVNDLGEERRLNSNDIGYVISTPIVPEFLTGREFLEFYLDINKDRIKDMKSIDEYFEMFELNKDDQNKLLKDYSQGMKNKIQMLVNIIIKPKVILLDEPLTSLDIVVQDQIKKILKSYRDEHIIIFSTHILELAMDLCDAIVILNNKKLELIEKKKLSTKGYKEKIINSLKESSND